jgi:prepilin-type N-terminal cleavage/methylation domain-containing protein
MMSQGVRGFSLIEILVVITIIGLLIAVSGGAYMKYTSYSQWVKTKALITELETYARDYNDRRGDFPPSSLKSLGIASSGDEANEGIEAFVQALFFKDYNGLRPDSTDQMINADGDEASKNKTIFDRAELLEFQDSWGNPLIYIRHTDYGKSFSYSVSEAEELWDTVEVKALKNPATGSYFKFESCQIMSVGEDGMFDTDDDVANFDRVE